MTVDSKRSVATAVRSRKYLNRDFDSFRADLEEYARTFFPNKMQDFSANGFGGLLIELASYVGDVQSFYLDHQFGELNAETAVESKNLERLLREAGVDIVGAAPAVVPTTFYARIPADTNGSFDRTALPVFKAGTIVDSNQGIRAQLFDDVDLTVTKSDGLPAVNISYAVGEVDTNNIPANYIFSAVGDCLTSMTTSDTFTVNGFEAFKRCTLSSRDVTDIVSVVDSDGNNYYEVNFLTQDTVFKAVKNKIAASEAPVDQPYVDYNLEILPAPYRFFRTTALDTRLTTLTFGGGSGDAMDDDLIPDPSEAALPLYGKRTFSRFTIDPNNLLRTGTLGAIAPNVTLTVTYRAGGGLNHNISPQSITGIGTLGMEFPGGCSATVASNVRASADANNNVEGIGGDDAPTLEVLRLQIPSARRAQSRIVSKEDIVARIYSLPSNFGRVYRASIRNNPNNPNSGLLYILCRNEQGQLTLAPDLLKKNLQVYLNQYRMISDAIDILDGRVVNLQVNYDITVDPTASKQLILQNVQAKLIRYFNVGNFQMDQPLVLDDIRNIIYNNIGVLSVRGIVVNNLTGTVSGRTYSSVSYDVSSNLIDNSILLPPQGGIFEIKYLKDDIIGR